MSTRDEISKLERELDETETELLEARYRRDRAQDEMETAGSNLTNINRRLSKLYDQLLLEK